MIFMGGGLCLNCIMPISRHTCTNLFFYDFIIKGAIVHRIVFFVIYLLLCWWKRWSVTQPITINVNIRSGPTGPGAQEPGAIMQSLFARHPDILKTLERGIRQSSVLHHQILKTEYQSVSEVGCWHLSSPSFSEQNHRQQSLWEL